MKEVLSSIFLVLVGGVFILIGVKNWLLPFLPIGWLDFITMPESLLGKKLYRIAWIVVGLIMIFLGIWLFVI